ncbi:MAG TPA: lipopolysaccharide kinase InaA family protein [Planctomycetota bacterium]|nr:lipopolysaccharide kinase InaA family protein [Planctomycetota bacterium]
MEFEDFQACGFVGKVSPAFRSSVSEWLKDAGEGLVRSREGRQVFRLADGLIAKAYSNFRGLIGVLLPAGLIRARREFNNLLAAARKGIPVPMATGLVRSRERAVVFMRDLQSASPLESVLSRSVVVRVGSAVREALTAGLWHPDLHAGNILVRDESVYFIDLLTARILSRPVVGARRVWMLAALVGSIERNATLSDLARLLKSAGCTEHQEWRSVCELLAGMRARHAASRAAHSLRGGAGCRRFSRDGWTVVARDELAPDAVEPAIRTAVSLHRGRAVKSWSTSVQLEHRGVPANRFEAVAWNRGRGALVPSPLVGAISLTRFLEEHWPRLEFRKRRDALRHFAVFLRRAHDLGASNLEKVLIRDRPDGFWALSLDGIETVRLSVKTTPAQRKEDLERLDGRYGRLLTQTERIRFLRRYGPTADR